MVRRIFVTHAEPEASASMKLANTRYTPQPTCSTLHAKCHIPYYTNPILPAKAHDPKAWDPRNIQPDNYYFTWDPHPTSNRPARSLRYGTDTPPAGLIFVETTYDAALP